MMVRVEGADELALVLCVAGVVVEELPSRQVDEEWKKYQKNGTA